MSGRQIGHAGRISMRSFIGGREVSREIEGREQKETERKRKERETDINLPASSEEWQEGEGK